MTYQNIIDQNGVNEVLDQCCSQCNSTVSSNCDYFELDTRLVGSTSLQSSNSSVICRLKKLTISGITTSTSLSSRWTYLSGLITGYDNTAVSSMSDSTQTTTTTISPLKLTGDSCLLKN